MFTHPFRRCFPIFVRKPKNGALSDQTEKPCGFPDYFGSKTVSKWLQNFTLIFPRHVSGHRSWRAAKKERQQQGCASEAKNVMVESRPRPRPDIAKQKPWRVLTCQKGAMWVALTSLAGSSRGVQSLSESRLSNCQPFSQSPQETDWHWIIVNIYIIVINEPLPSSSARFGVWEKFADDWRQLFFLL